MSIKADDLRRLVNRSGFPFQLAVERQIAEAHIPHLQVACQEHPWKEPDGPRSGFIDTVIHGPAVRVVVECKRTKDASWVLLRPVEQQSNGLPRVRLRWWGQLPGQRSASGWYDFALMKPDVPEASFCVVRGQGERDSPMLEKMCGELLAARDSVLEEESHLEIAAGLGRYYVPLIVTNATLALCTFDPSKVNLVDGELSSDNAAFQELSAVRFRKSMRVAREPVSPGNNLTTLSEATEETVLVVNAAHLVEFLRGLKVQPVGLGGIPGEGWPWRGLC